MFWLWLIPSPHPNGGGSPPTSSPALGFLPPLSINQNIGLLLTLSQLKPGKMFWLFLHRTRDISCCWGGLLLEKGHRSVKKKNIYMYIYFVYLFACLFFVCVCVLSFLPHPFERGERQNSYVIPSCLPGKTSHVLFGIQSRAWRAEMTADLTKACYKQNCYKHYSLILI